MFDNIHQKYSMFSWQWARMILELIIHGSGGALSPVQNAFSSNAISSYVTPGHVISLTIDSFAGGALLRAAWQLSHSGPEARELVV